MYGIHRMAGVRAKIYVEDLLDTTPPQQVLAHWEGLAPAPFFGGEISDLDLRTNFHSMNRAE
jgi:hypothetical protein